ncbi:thymidylate kinase [Firmicutes bacterium CAG:822]|nr:thymidylate kinase [Firmicutes bacterium CAG:822]
MQGKLITIEGTDCSGKETQTNLLIQKLRAEGYQVQNFSFPNYNSPTGRIIGGPYLGKEGFDKCYFEEGATKVDPKVASLYYAADRKYNIGKINFLLEQGYNVILDRYIYSNMAHQGGKIIDQEERKDMYNWLDKLEFDLMELPKPDLTIFLHMPTKVAEELKRHRREKADGHEKDGKHLEQAEISYLELAKKYNFVTIECAENGKPKDIEAINQIVYNKVKPYMNKRG